MLRKRGSIMLIELGVFLAFGGSFFSITGPRCSELKRSEVELGSANSGSLAKPFRDPHRITKTPAAVFEVFRSADSRHSPQRHPKNLPATRSTATSQKY
jgi:hypothetical protein